MTKVKGRGGSLSFWAFASGSQASRLNRSSLAAWAESTQTALRSERLDEEIFGIGVRITYKTRVPSFKPTKTPIQERSAVTVRSITEATIQVLHEFGLDRLTTTRVAERAGVSVGTLYQYYPNKQSLLFGLLEKHMDGVSAEIEAACEAARGKPLLQMLEEVVNTFVAAKLSRTDIAIALYRISGEIGGPAIVRRTVERSRRALAEMIASAPDLTLPPDEFAIEVLYAAMAGATRSMLEAGAPPDIVLKLRDNLTILCQAYVTTVTRRV